MVGNTTTFSSQVEGRPTMKFNLKVQTNTKDNEVNSIIEDIYCKDVKSALQMAKDLSHNNYYINPIRDILEIMEELKVDEQEAGAIFMNDLAKNTSYYVEEIIEEGNLVHYDEDF